LLAVCRPKRIYIHHLPERLQIGNGRVLRHRANKFDCPHALGACRRVLLRDSGIAGLRALRFMMVPCGRIVTKGAAFLNASISAPGRPASDFVYYTGQSALFWRS
jgi:hypothetical protein